MTPIENAVLPLKETAVDAAADAAFVKLHEIFEKLNDSDWDINKAAPRPDAFSASRKEYMSIMAVHKMFASVTTTDKEKHPGGTLRPFGPRYVVWSEEMVDRFIDEAKKNAAAQYDAFVAKLVDKVGDHKTAELEGNHVWGHSILTIDGKDFWKTKMIINVSKLGKMFNQFPTRKVKNK